MKFRDSTTEYSAVSKSLHWIIALLILGMMSIGMVMGSLHPQSLRGLMYMLHKSFGLLVLLFMLLRVGWRIYSPAPPLPVATPVWQRIAVASVHGLLYLTLLTMPLAGWVMSSAAGHPPQWFGLFTLALPIAKSKAVAKTFALVHYVLAWVISGLLVLHIGGAFFHRVICMDNLGARMWFKPIK